jgi:acyl carrier protein
MAADDIPAWDSVKHINLVFHIERTFGVRLTTAELANLRRVGDLKKCVAKKLGIQECA